MGFGQSSWLAGGVENSSSYRVGGIMMPTMKRLMTQLMSQCFSLSSGAKFSSGRNPGFGCGAGPSRKFSTSTGCEGARIGLSFKSFLGACSGPRPDGPPGKISPSFQVVGQLIAKLPPALRDHAGSFSSWGKKYGVDPKFLAAVSMMETGKGTSSAFRNKNNAMGFANARGPIAFSSVDASIERLARILAEPNGPYAGRHTIEQIARVNAGHGTHWTKMVSKFFAALGGDPYSSVK